MRNTNTSFIKNAICRFANEAGQVLRAFSDPATCLLRLIRSVVRTFLGYVLPTGYRLQPFSPSGTSLDKVTLPATIDRIMSAMWLGETGKGHQGNVLWDCLAGQTVS